MVCVSLRTNTFGEDINPSILPPALIGWLIDFNSMSAGLGVILCLAVPYPPKGTLKSILTLLRLTVLRMC